MKTFSKKLLVSSVGMLMMGGSMSQLVWADEQSVLPVIRTTAQQDADAFADGKLAKKTTLGILGEKNVVDTPYSVTEYTNELMAQQQTATIGQILKNDPSIRITSNQGHLNENFKIRGFDVNHEDMNFNGFYGMAPYGRVPTEFLETVTVLKGPNALVAGVPPTGSVGAVVIANSKRADKDVTQVSAVYEDGGYYKSGFDFSRRFGESKEFGVRVNGAYGDGEHIIDNMNDRHASGAIAADYTTDKARINFDAYAIREDRKGGSPAMIAMGPDVKNKYGSVDHILAAPEGGLNYFPHLEGQTESKFAGLSGEYQFTPDLKAFAGVAHAEKEYSGHLFGTRMIVGKEDGTATSQYYRVGANEKNTAANAGLESKFDTGAVKHTLAFRADYLKRKVNQHEGRGATPVDFETNIYNPSNQGGMPQARPNIVPLADNEYTSYSLSDQLSMLDDRLQLILGVRYQDIDTKNLVAKTEYSEDKVSPSLGIVVKPFGEDLSLYASYVEGLTEGTTVNNVVDVNDKKTFAPFKTTQYEFGAKYQKGDWLNTLALYQIEKPGVMTVTIPKDADGNTQITTDGVETRSRGVEWTFSGKVLEDLSLMGGVAYTDAEYTKGKAKVAGKDEDVTGKQIYGVPEWTASLGLDYAIPFADGLSVNTRASYVGEQYTNNRNNLELPDFTIWDLGARYKTKVGGVNTTLLANVDNVTNKKYWEGVFNPDYLLVGGGRTYKLGVTFDF